MEKPTNYTQQEIDETINSILDSIELKKGERTEITKYINKQKKRLEYWRSIDKRQLKMF